MVALSIFPFILLFVVICQAYSGKMARSALLYVLVAVIALSFVPRVAAFGAGNIAGYSYLEDKAFRHGDIEDIIATMAKMVGGGFLGRSKKFTGLDVKRVYFVCSSSLPVLTSRATGFVTTVR